MAYQKTEHFECDICGLGTGPTDAVEPDDNGIPYPPTGWARITVEVAVPNPDYVSAMKERAEGIEEQVQALVQDQVKAGRTPTNDEINQARGLLLAQAPLPDEDEFSVELNTAALCPQHISEVARLGLGNWLIELGAMATPGAGAKS